VGKSILASHWHGEANSLDWVVPDTSSDVEIKPISIGDWTKIVSVIPGQESNERLIALNAAFAQGSRLEGVIHVVDWGYTTIRDSAVKKEMVARGIDSIRALRKHNMALELDEFKYLAEQIKTANARGVGPKWLVVAVNKIDLYESKHEDAKQYYHPSCSGDFSHLIGGLCDWVGTSNLKVACLPVCAMPEPFTWNEKTKKSEIDSVTRQRSYMRKFIDDVALLQNGT